MSLVTGLFFFFFFFFFLLLLLLLLLLVVVVLLLTWGESSRYLLGMRLGESHSWYEHFEEEKYAITLVPIEL
jgi:fatty acid desaturase